jgi:hypothetical protein
MKVTRDVITDLLPAYQANEASNDTRALVEEFLKEDPEFASLVNENKSEELLGVLPAAPLGKNHERETLIRTRNLLRWRAHWFALAFLFTVFPLSSAFNSHGLVWIMLRDAPQFASTCWVIAVVCWVLFLRTKRKLRPSGI